MRVCHRRIRRTCSVWLNSHATLFDNAGYVDRWRRIPVPAVSFSHVSPSRQVILGPDRPLQQLGGKGKLLVAMVRMPKQVVELGWVGGEIVHFAIALRIEHQLPVTHADHLQIPALGDTVEAIECCPLVGKVEGGAFVSGVAVSYTH